jgi:uncharacterized protein (TIGR03382 family)
MFVQDDKLRVGGRGIDGLPVLATITGLRGTWIRVVTRIKMSTAGAFEVWVNGTKSLSLNGDFRAVGPSLRWSAGIYCTRWDTETPTGQRVLSIFHDSMRVATTLEEADPASWGGEGPSMPPPDAGADAGEVAPDAGMADAGFDPGTGGAIGTGGSAGGTGGATGTGGVTGTGGSRGGTGGAPGTGGSPSEPDPNPTPPARASAKGGCQLAGGGGEASLTVLVLALAALRARRRSRWSGSGATETFVSRSR